MRDLLTELTALSVSVFNQQPEYDYVDPFFDLLGASSGFDTVLRESQRMSVVLPDRHEEFAHFVEHAFALQDLEMLHTPEGELPPMLFYPGGGMRVMPDALVAGILRSSFLQMFFLRLPWDENTFVRTVLEGFEELRRAARGEHVRMYVVQGICGTRLGEGRQLHTPWGVLRPAPAVAEEPILSLDFRAKTTCLMTQSVLTSVQFDRAQNPERDEEAPAPVDSAGANLFPLACALGCEDLAEPAVPMTTWTVMHLPFLPGPSYSMPALPLQRSTPKDVTGQIDSIEEWSRRVNEHHSPAVDLAVRRLVSSIAHRSDRADALIDAVMGWENLLGTSSEVTFRVTGAMAKLLEPDPAQRRPARRLLAEAYRVRSRLVHGSVVPDAEVRAAADTAVSVLIRAMRAAYLRGRDWLALKSSERAEKILLEEP